MLWDQLSQEQSIRKLKNGNSSGLGNVLVEVLNSSRTLLIPFPNRHSLSSIGDKQTEDRFG